MNLIADKKTPLILAIPLAEIAFWDRLVHELESLGYQVFVWTEITERAYRGRRGWLGGLWIRCRVWCVFPLRVLGRCMLRPSCWRAVLLIPTTPFYLPAAAATLLSPTGIRVIHLLYDLYPDQLILAGKVRRGSLIALMLSWSTRLAIRFCTATVFLGGHLRKAAESQYGNARRGVIIEVGGDGQLLAGEPVISSGGVQLLYSGNFGYAHDYETLLGVIARPLPRGIELVFHASGAGYEALKRELLHRGKNPQVKLAGPLETADWARVMAAAQVALVTMRPGSENILFPSKTYSAMLAGQAILAVCPRTSDLAATIEAAGAGWVIEPDDSAGLWVLLKRLAEDPELVQQARVRSQTYAREHFDMAVIAKKWERLLNDLEARKEGA